MQEEIDSIGYIVDSWREHVKEGPNAVRLSDCEGGKLTRGEVEDLSNRVNGWLRSRGIGREDMVLINLDRGVKPVVAIMGVWKAGAAFTVVESTYAPERINFIREDSGAKLDIDESDWQEILATRPVEEIAHPDPHDLCLMVYTSGTTGNPKGVIHEYGQLKLEMLSERRADGTFREGPNTRWGLVAPLNFVASLKFVVHFYYSGGHLIIIDYDTVKNPKKLGAFFLRKKVEGVFISPSLLRFTGDDFGPFVKFVYTGAEPANNVSIKRAELGNTYTMSESFFTVSKFIITKPYPIVPIGNPTFDLKIKLVDENGNEVPEGERGDLCYENPYCRGYVNNPEQNAEHFRNGWYRTGDLAEYKDGVYVLKGRADDMIKIDGNRIEPAEIEAACREELGLPSCAARGFEERGFVALYYVDDIKIDENEARKKLEQRLPYYMIPTYFIKIDKYPLMKSGKLNRRGLEEPKDIFKEEYVAPRNDFERKLSAAFSEALSVKDIGIKDDFFKLGGSSLKTMQVLSILDEDELLTPTLIYQGRTIEKISALYENAKANYFTPEEKEEKGRKARYPLSRTTKWYWDNVNDGFIDFYSCFQISGFVPAGKLVKGINNYIAHNSTFNLVLEEGEDGVPVQVYTDKTPFVEVERMSEAKAQEEIAHFVRPFGYNEPLIRIRVIRAGFHNYLMFHAFHLVVDGASAHFMIEGMLNAVMGKSVEETRYFAWAFEENMRSKSPLIDENRAYLSRKYDLENCDICIHADSNTGQSGIGIAPAASVSLEDAQRYCATAGVSMQCFLSAAGILAQAAYNGTVNNNLFWNYNNRGPKENKAGVMIRVAACEVASDDVISPNDLYANITKQNEDQLGRLYEYDYFNTEVVPVAKTPNMTITYLEDWFSQAALPSIVGKEIPLVNTSPVSPESEKNFVLVCTHEDGKLCMTLNYGKSYLTEEHAKKFSSMLEFSMKELMQDRLPRFTAFN